MISNPLITIAIPVYNHPELLDPCLESIEKQEFKEYQVLLVDDNSKIGYERVIQKYANLNIKYIKNAKNLGSVPNMMQCINWQYNSKYFMVFREDDLLHPQFLKYSLSLLEENEELVFSCCNMEFFKKYSDVRINHFNSIETFYCDKSSFVLKILEGNPISWASVVYRSDFKRPNFRYNKFSMLGDRPFLIDLLQNNKCAFITNRLIIAFAHGLNDNRWDLLRCNHILNLYRYYFNLVATSKKAENRKPIKKYITLRMADNYRLLKKRSIFIYLMLFLRALHYHLISVKYLILQNRTIRKFFEKLKHANCLY